MNRKFMPKTTKSSSGANLVNSIDKKYCYYYKFIASHFFSPKEKQNLLYFKPTQQILSSKAERSINEKELNKEYTGKFKLLSTSLAL